MATIHALTLGDLARENARRYRSRTAFITEDGAELTYPEVDQRSTCLANALRAAGLGAGSRILWCGQNSVRVMELVLAASKIGAIVCPANWRSSADELLHVFDDWRPELVFWQTDELGETIEKVRAAWAGPARWLQHDGVGPDGYEEFLAGGAREDREEHVSADVPVLAIYTAAFDGRPKAALLTSNNLLATSVTVLLVRQFTADDRMLLTPPAFHIMHWSEALPIFLTGGLNVFIRRVDAAEICRLVDQYRCTRAYAVSLTRDQVVAHAKVAGLTLSSLRSTGDDAWASIVAPDNTPHGRLGGMYGQTEVSGVACYECFGAPSIGRAGRPGPFAAARIWDDEGRELPVGAVGEIVLSGPMVMDGYHNDPKGRALMEKGGWRRTNDLGRREEDGSITFIAPKGRIVKSGVENIYPVEVERCIASIPGVDACAIIGVPDPQLTQAVKAIVVRGSGAQVTVEDVVVHCLANIASYKKPRSVEFVDELPMTGSQVDYEELDRRFGGGNYPGGSTRQM